MDDWNGTLNTAMQFFIKKNIETATTERIVSEYH